MSLLVNSILVPFSYLFAYSPRWFQISLGDFFGFLWFDVFRLRRKVILDNLNLAFPEWDHKKKVSVGRKSVQNLCLSFLEYLLVMRFKSEWREKYFEIHGFESVDADLKKGHGVFLMSLHLGAIDLALSGYRRFGYNITFTTKRIKNKTFDNFMRKIRDKEGLKTIEDRRNPFDIFRALKNNECVLFIMDQFMGRPHGIPVQFFGHPAATAAGLAAFSIKTGLAVHPVYNYRKDGKVILQAEEPILVDLQGDREQNIKLMTQKYNDRIESIIRKYPEQWLWVHKRWKGYI